MPTSGQAASLALGAAWGRYVILDRLGEGAMGVVYAAYDPRLERKVALKLLRSNSGASATPEGRARMVREAQAMARLSHPNVLSVYDVGELEGEVFIAMEFVEGSTLRHWLAQRPRAWRQVLRALEQAGQGLAAAHAAGIIHRDFKPDNVLVDKEDRVRVTDFGLARPSELGVAGETVPVLADVPAGELTETGTILGTPAYMAPEQFAGCPSDHRADQFAFTVTIYEALYGERPFKGETLATLAHAVTLGRIQPPPKDQRVPGWLRRVLLRGLAADPADRFASMDELLLALSRDPRRWPVRVGAVLLLGLAVAASGAGLGTWRTRHEQLCRGGERKLAGVWDPVRRREIQEALARTGQPYSVEAARGSTRALDEYAAGWTAMYTEACQATQRGEQPESMLTLRMRCLERRRRDLGALVDLFSNPDAAVAERAVVAARGLQDLKGCADTEALASVVEPADERVRADVERVRSKVSEAKAFLAAGKYAQGLELARDFATRASALGYAPLIAEALTVRGDLEELLGDGATEATLREAIRAAERGRDDEVRAEARMGLSVYEGEVVGRSEEAVALAEDAAAVVDRLGPGRDELRAGAEQQLAAALVRAGQPERALRAYQNALMLREKAFPAGHPAIARTLEGIGLVLGILGRRTESIEFQSKALQNLEREVGPGHPDVAQAQVNLGGILTEMGHYAEARDLFRRSLAVYEKTVGPRHPLVGMGLNAVGYLEAKLGNTDTAVALLKRSLDSLGDQNQSADLAILTHDSLGETYRLNGRLREAEAEFRMERELAKRSSNVDRATIARVQRQLAECTLSRGDAASALRQVREARRLDEARSGDAPELVLDLLTEGRCLVALRRQREAVPALERGLAIAERQAAAPGTRGELAFLLGKALGETGLDRARSVALVRKARDTLSQGEGRDRLLLPETEAWLRQRP
jgi:tetratricopeptide (TPR) repeat protein/predicted Ser/Thr protein kinase